MGGKDRPAVGRSLICGVKGLGLGGGVVVVERTCGGVLVVWVRAACLLAQLAESEQVMYTFIRAVV